MPDIIKVADTADMIVNGYAFTKENGMIRVLNLNHPERACVLTKNGEMAETTMDDVELSIVSDYYQKNKKYLEES
ncbi:DUF7723 family protein [Faecalibacterium hattorii]|jgi:hypothetical protein|uniref:DUF7723 domain-containing protein n=1 Tax=Faecalibacterium hattorii TaxID=2935520 RepID=A0A329UHQ2_9FIRM|nr:hypothetical protein [Faecalibacterium hattorii]RAW60484.1 hypothetical protein C4N23_08795 [Faecalibacterium hattorii]